MNSNISLNLNYSINIESCSLDNITALIKKLLPLILEDLVAIILLDFGQKYKGSNITSKCNRSDRPKPQGEYSSLYGLDAF